MVVLEKLQNHLNKEQQKDSYLEFSILCNSKHLGLLNYWMIISVVDKTSSCLFWFCFHFLSEIRDIMKLILCLMLPQLPDTFYRRCNAHSSLFPLFLLYLHFFSSALSFRSPPFLSPLNFPSSPLFWFLQLSSFHCFLLMTSLPSGPNIILGSYFMLTIPELWKQTNKK